MDEMFKLAIDAASKNDHFVYDRVIECIIECGNPWDWLNFIKLAKEKDIHLSLSKIYESIFMSDSDEVINEAKRINSLKLIDLVTILHSNANINDKLDAISLYAMSFDVKPLIKGWLNKTNISEIIFSSLPLKKRLIILLKLGIEVEQLLPIINLGEHELNDIIKFWKRTNQFEYLTMIEQNDKQYIK